MAERALTDLQLERVIAGDRELDRRATDADRARLAELRTDGEKFLAAIDVDAEVRRIQQRADREPKRNWFRWIAPFGALAAAAAVALVLIRRPANDAGNDIQTKGDIALVIHTVGGTLASGDTVAAGDKLRFEVSGTQPGYVAVIGVDGTGARTIYYPYGGAQAAPIGNRDRLLPGAIALDATPGDEKFTAVFSTHPFALDPLPAGVVSSDVVLHKK